MPSQWSRPRAPASSISIEDTTAHVPSEVALGLCMAIGCHTIEPESSYWSARDRGRNLIRDGDGTIQMS